MKKEELKEWLRRHLSDEGEILTEISNMMKSGELSKDDQKELAEYAIELAREMVGKYPGYSEAIDSISVGSFAAIATAVKGEKTEKFNPTNEQIESLLNIGLRMVDVTKQEGIPTGDAIAGFMLIPIKNSEWQRIKRSKWEGSYIPLVVYRSGNAAILVPYGEEMRWQAHLADKLSEILGLNVKAIED